MMVAARALQPRNFGFGGAGVRQVNTGSDADPEGGGRVGKSDLRHDEANEKDRQ